MLLKKSHPIGPLPDGTNSCRGTGQTIINGTVKPHNTRPPALAYPVSVIRIDWMEHKSGWSANAPFWRHSQLPGFMSASRPIPVIPALDLRPRKLPFVKQKIEGCFASREQSSKSLPLGSDRYRHSTCSLEATLGLVLALLSSLCCSRESI